MTNNRLYRALGNIDPEMIEAAAPAEKARTPKKIVWLKWASAAACLFLAVMTGIFAVPNLIGYQSGGNEDEIFERTNTYFTDYGELASVIGNGTLLENIDFSSLYDYELRLKHELDNVNDYHTVSFVDIMPEDSFGFGIYFPPYKEKNTSFVENGDTVTINGVTVKYKNMSDGTKSKYHYNAEFEYGGCCYQIIATGNSDESIFWEKLHSLIEG